MLVLQLDDSLISFLSLFRVSVSRFSFSDNGDNLVFKSSILSFYFFTQTRADWFVQLSYTNNFENLSLLQFLSFVHFYLCSSHQWCMTFFHYSSIYMIPSSKWWWVDSYGSHLKNHQNKFFISFPLFKFLSLLSLLLT
jgi:hypothetical protein